MIVGFNIDFDVRPDWCTLSIYRSFNLLHAMLTFVAFMTGRYSAG